MKPFKKNGHYDNILLLCPDKSPLSTISKRKLQFYLTNDLVIKEEDQEGYLEVYSLKFEPNLTRKIKKRDYVPIDNKCVVTGETENLTLHHVVPYCIRKYFPEKYKSKSKEWCVLLIPEIHDIADKITFQVYQTDRNNYYKEHSHKIFPKIRKLTVYNLVRSGDWEGIPEERQRVLLEEAELETIDFEDNVIDKIKKDLDKDIDKIYKNWTKKFIKEYGGIENVHYLFKNLFIERFQPKYLPSGYLEFDPKEFSSKEN